MEVPQTLRIASGNSPSRIHLARLRAKRFDREEKVDLSDEKDAIIRDFQKNAEELGIIVDGRMLSSFALYYKNLVEWNKVMNLTAITEEKDVYEKHFLDSLTITQIVSRETLEKGCTILDMGTGAGFPGLPIAIVFPKTKVVLMDSLNKRIRFLEDTIGQLGLTNVTAVHARAEELARKKDYREKFDLCCSRAVANLATLSEYCLPFVRKGGQFVSYKTEQVQEEIEKSRKAVHALGGGNEQTVFFTLPGTEYKRSLVLIEKVSPTPSKYPRKAGTPSKEPIN